MARRCSACNGSGYVLGAYHPQHNPSGERACPVCDPPAAQRPRRATALTGLYAPAAGVRS